MRSIHLSVPVGDFFGAGVCGKYLLREFAKVASVTVDVRGETLASREDSNLVFRHNRFLRANPPGALIEFTGPDLESQSVWRGRPHVGYAFFETDELTPKQVENARSFDILVAGSTWNRDVLSEHGVKSVAIAQGVNTELFRPEVVERDARFTIFSAGKWEHRKGQDLVLRAVKVLQDRHADIDLVSLWYNPWTKHDGGAEARAVGVRMLTLPPRMEHDIPACMHATDIGLFPNRCEGGTNLFLMDYLACGKPVIANNSTGQSDVLEPSYALMASGTDDEVVEAMVSGVEFLYASRDARRRMGERAAAFMKLFSWERTARHFMAAIEEWEQSREGVAA